MKMYACDTVKPNFGDELNAWMWPQLLSGSFDGNDSELFLGIGSILYNSFPSSSLKVVFGAGYGGYTPPPKIDKAWRIYFVRGKLTAKYLSIDPALALGDAAILVRSCVGPEPQKRFKVSFMPHWESTLVGDWESVCGATGVHFLDPCAAVPKLLDEVRASELVITEAMHGAIVSDALRVPWIPIRPISQIHRMKWEDWASALGLLLKPAVLGASSFPEYLSGTFNSYRVTHALQKRKSRLLDKFASQHFLDRASTQLAKIALAPASMSSDLQINSAHEGMLCKLKEFQRDFPK